MLKTVAFADVAVTTNRTKNISKSNSRLVRFVEVLLRNERAKGRRSPRQSTVFACWLRMIRVEPLRGIEDCRFRIVAHVKTLPGVCREVI